MLRFGHKTGQTASNPECKPKNQIRHSDFYIQIEFLKDWDFSFLEMKVDELEEENVVYATKDLRPTTSQKIYGWLFIHSNELFVYVVSTEIKCKDNVYPFARDSHLKGLDLVNI